MGVKADGSYGRPDSGGLPQANGANRRRTRHPITEGMAFSVSENKPERLGFRVEEAAEAIGVSRDLIYDLIRTGELRSLKVGRRRIISRQAIEDFMNGQAA